MAKSSFKSLTRHGEETASNVHARPSRYSTEKGGEMPVQSGRSIGVKDVKALIRNQEETSKDYTTEGGDELCHVEKEKRRGKPKKQRGRDGCQGRKTNVTLGGNGNSQLHILLKARPLKRRL